MDEHIAEKDALTNLRDALDKIAKASRVIIVHPDHEDDVRTAVAEAPFPGLFEVTVSKECPTDRVFLIPKPQDTRPIPPGVCPTPGCPGDTRYAAPGRRHIEGCTYPIPPGK